MIDDNSPGNPDLQAALKGLVDGASKPEVSEPGPGDVGPTIETKGNPLVTLDMPETEVTAWWDRVKASDDRLQAVSGEWDTLLDEYKAHVSKTGTAEDVKTPKHFRNTHSKIGSLFFSSPDPILTPKSPSPADNQQPNPLALMNPMVAPMLKAEDIISVKQAILQDKLGRDNINYNRLMDELLFDALAWSGIACSKLGYQCYTRPMQEPVMGPDPNWVPPPPSLGSILGLGGESKPPQIQMMDEMGQPKTQPVDVPIFEEYYERRFSPKKVIFNSDLHSTRFDQDATFMGMHFYIAKNRVLKMFKTANITEEDLSKLGNKDEKRAKHKHDDSITGQEQDLVHGVELWVRASFFTDEPHPQVIYQLVLLEGMKRPVIWRLSPDQTIGEDGRLTIDSMIGFPIEVLTLRDLADSPFPSSDSAFTNNTIKQINTYRRQGVEIREAAIGHYLYDASAFDDTQKKLLSDGKPGRHIPVENGALRQNGAKGVLDTTAQVHRGMDDSRMEANFSKDLDETLGIGPVQSGTTEDSIHTATEIATAQSSAVGRNGKEKARVIDKYLSSCRKIDQLLMRYATEQDYISITGDDGARRMVAWNNSVIAVRCMYDISPDSQLSPDMARDRKALLEYYNMTANDQLSNRVYLLRRLTRMYALDPLQAVFTPQQLALQMMGMPMPGMGGPETGAPGGMPSPVAQPPHGGAATPGAPVNKHSATTSGRRPNEPGAEAVR